MEKKKKLKKWHYILIYAGIIILIGFLSNAFPKFFQHKAVQKADPFIKIFVPGYKEGAQCAEAIEGLFEKQEEPIDTPDYIKRRIETRRQFEEKENFNIE